MQTPSLGHPSLAWCAYAPANEGADQESFYCVIGVDADRISSSDTCREGWISSRGAEALGVEPHGKLDDVGIAVGGNDETL